jgi:hypothetical protein
MIGKTIARRSTRWSNVRPGWSICCICPQRHGDSTPRSDPRCSTCRRHCCSRSPGPGHGDGSPSHHRSIARPPRLVLRLPIAMAARLRREHPRLLLDYFPERTDLSVHSPGHLRAVVDELNNRPRPVDRGSVFRRRRHVRSLLETGQTKWPALRSESRGDDGHEKLPVGGRGVLPRDGQRLVPVDGHEIPRLRIHLVGGPPRSSCRLLNTVHVRGGPSSHVLEGEDLGDLGGLRLDEVVPVGRRAGGL